MCRISHLTACHPQRMLYICPCVHTGINLYIKKIRFSLRDVQEIYIDQTYYMVQLWEGIPIRVSLLGLFFELNQTLNCNIHSKALETVYISIHPRYV